MNTERDEQGKFLPGTSGNPAGRPKGARNKLSQAFIEALSDDFSEHGTEAIRAMREESPRDYNKVIAALLPKLHELSGRDGEDIAVSGTVQIVGEAVRPDSG